MKQSETFTAVADDSFIDMRLDLAASYLFPQFSRSRLQKAIKRGDLLVNGEEKKAKELLVGGEELTLRMEQESDPMENPAAQAMKLDLLYEDDDLLILNKPAGLVVHPGAGNHDNTLLNGLLHHYPALAELERFGIVHRLDRETSGALLVAKNSEAEAHLKAQFAERTPLRIYHALVLGEMISGSTIDLPMGRNPYNRKKMMVTEDDEEGNNEGREAITHLRVLERYRAHTLVQAQLETGRTHQIRVHLSYNHYPIVGDPLYGGRLNIPKGFSDQNRTILTNFKRQALHAYTLGFEHPKSGEWIEANAPYPKDFNRLLAAMERDLKENS